MKNLFTVIYLLVLFALNTYAQNVSPDSALIACYPFSGNVNDMSNHGNDGVLHSATLVPDRFGSPNAAYSFDGVDSYISVPNFGEKLNPEEFSISFWVNGKSIKNQSPFLLTPDNPANRFNIHVFYTHNGDNATFFDFGDIYTTRLEFYPDPTSLNVWHHYVMTSSISSNKMELYIDGINVTTNSNSNSFTLDATKELQIGGGTASNGSSLRFDGEIDDIKIYGRAITAIEVSALYNATVEFPLNCAPPSTGISINHTSTNPFIYPNPSTDGHFNINLYSNTKLQVTNINGNIVYTNTFTSISNNNIDLSYLSNGIYILNTYSDKESSHTKISINK